MRMQYFLRSAMVLTLAVSPLVALAQVTQFPAPNPDELKMTADPKAPGAAAVYLDLQESADDNLHSRNYYARIKVLTEKGKEMATVEVYYGGEMKVTSIKARTIHPDGTIIPLEGKPEDLLSSKSSDARFGRKVFTLPSVDVGSILEYRYDIEYPEGTVSSPTWQIQQPFFVHKAHYSFTPFTAFLGGSQNVTSRYIYDRRTGETLDSLIWMKRLPPGTDVKSVGLGSLTLDIDVPAIPEEEWMPPRDSVLYKVDFYYKGSMDAQEFWEAEAKRWSKDVDHFAEVSGTIKAAAAGLVDPAATDLAKAKKLYDAVQALDNTDYTRKKTESEMKALNLKEAKRAEDTWKQKSGNSEDVAMLYLALAGAAVLNAHALKVVNRSRAQFDVGYLSASQFDDTLVVLTAGGKELCSIRVRRCVRSSR